MGDFPGHPFRGNQWTEGQSVARARDGERGVVLHGPVHVWRDDPDPGRFVYEVQWQSGSTSRLAGKELIPALESTRLASANSVPAAGVSTGDYITGQGGVVPSVPKGASMGKNVKGIVEGTEIVGYDWRSRIEDVENASEGSVAKRVSDWDRSDTSTGTGREIVHVFYVKHKDGSITTEGVNSAQRVLGFNTSKLRGIADRERRERDKAARETVTQEHAAKYRAKTDAWDEWLQKTGKGEDTGSRIASLGGFAAARKKYKGE